MVFNIGELQGTISLDTAEVDGQLSGVLGKFQEFASKGGAAAVAAGTAIGAGLSLAIAAAFEGDTVTRKIQASLGATEAESAKLGKSAGSLFAKNYGDSMDEVGEALVSVKKNMSGLGDVSAEVLEDITGQVISVSKTFDQDFNAVTRSAGQLMKTGLAKNAQEAMDIITKGLQSPVNAADDLLDTFDEYGTVFRSLGLDGKDALGLLSQGLQAGARDADQVADSLKEMLLRIQAGDSKQAIQDLGLNFSATLTAISKGGVSAKTATDAIIEGLRGIEDPAQRTALAVGIFGTKAEDAQQALGALDVDTAATQFEDAYGKISGAAKGLDETVGGSLRGAFDGVLRSMQGFVQQAGTQLAPFLSGAAAAFGALFDVLSGALSWLGDIPGPLWAIGAAVGVWASWTTIAANATALALALKGIGQAAVGMLASIGPIGWAIAAAGAAWAVFSALGDDAAAQAEAQAKYYGDLAGSIDQATGAITEATKATIRQKAEDSGIADTLRANGISMELYTSAALGSAEAQDQLASKIKGAKTAIVDSQGAFSGMGETLKAAKISQEELQQAIQTGDWSGVTAKIDAYTQSLNKQAGENFASEAITRQWTEAMGAAKGAVEGLDGVIAGAGDSSSQLAQAQTDVAATTGGVGSAADEAFQKLYAFATINKTSADEIARMGTEAGLTAPQIKSIQEAAGNAESEITPMAAALEASSNAASELDSMVQFLLLTLDEMNGGVISAEQATRANEAALREQAAAVREVDAAVRAKSDADNKQAEAQAKVNELTAAGVTSGADYEAAQRALTEANDGVAEATDGVAEAQDKQFESQVKARDSAVRMATAAYEAAVANGNLEGAADAANAVIEEQRRRFIAAQPEADRLSGKAGETARALYGIPGAIATTISESGASNVQGQAHGVTSAVGEIPPSKSTDLIANDYASSKISALQIAQIADKVFNIFAKVIGMPGGSTGGQVADIMSIPGFSGGGQVPGTPPANPREDNVLATAMGSPIALRSREWVQPEEAVDHYGANFMRAVQYRQFPKPQGYAEGGPVGPVSGGTGGSGTGRMVMELRLRGDGEITDIMAREATAVTIEAFEALAVEMER